MEFDVNTIGSFLRAERKKQQIPSKKMAEIVGYERSHLSKVEHLHIRPSLDLVTNYLNALGYELKIEVKRRDNGKTEFSWTDGV